MRLTSLFHFCFFQFAWRESWGEQHTDVLSPRLFVLDLASGKVTPVVASSHLVGWSLGRGCWARTDVVFTAWPPGQRLGIIYCTNRLSQIFRVSVDADSEEVGVPQHIAGTATLSALSPTISPDGTILLYLATKVGGPHCQSAQLVARKWSPSDVKGSDPVVIIDHGVLYSTDLVRHKVWLGPASVVLQTNFRSRTQLLVANVDIDGASPSSLVSGDRFRFVAGFDDPGKSLGLGAVSGVGSAVLLAARAGHAIVSFSSPCCPPVLLHGIIGRDGEGSFAPITPILAPLKLRHKIISLAPHARGEAILYEPTEDAAAHKTPAGSRPLIVWPHGGPHSMTTCNYSDYAAAFVEAGFVVVAPNYVGSAGYVVIPPHCFWSTSLHLVLCTT